MTTKSVLDEVEKRLKEATSSLKESLGSYWPTHDDRCSHGAHERNISLHVAHAFLGKGYAAFGESHGKEKGAKVRFDLVAISKSKDHVIACEFKQLWTPSRAESMKEDFHRLNAFKPLPWFPEGVPVIGVIAAFATAKKFVLPFDKKKKNLNQNERCEKTEEFCKTLREEKKKAHSLGYDALLSEGQPARKKPAFVYAVFEIAPGAAASSNPQH